MPNSRVADSYFEGTLSSSDDVPVYSIWYQGDGSIVVVVGSTCTMYIVHGTEEVVVVVVVGCVPVHGTEEVEVVVVVGCQDLCPRLDWYCRLTDVGKVVPRVQNINAKKNLKI